MIKGIIFDVSGVITDENPQWVSRIIAKKFNLSYDQVWNVIFITNYYLARVGKLTAKEYYKKSIKELGIGTTYSDFVKIYIKGNSIREEMLKLVKSLAKTYPLFILSNQTQLNTDYLHPRLDPYFKISIYSNEVKTYKPEKKIFSLLLDKISISPEDLLFIDDKEESLTPAKNLGMQVYFFSEVTKLKEDLKKILAD